MRATVRDREALQALLPLEIAAYLRTHGWREVSRGHRAAVWADGNLEVLLPLDSGLRDYPLRLSELLKTLEAAEGRSQLDILADLSTTVSDVIPLKAGAPEARFILEGFVTALQREAQTQGFVTVTGLVEGSLRKVRIELDGGDYERAIEAHKARSLVSCEGDLAREGNLYVLRAHRGFRFAEPPNPCVLSLRPS